ncbi:MAG TPA: Sir2 family NAD-dependent protein deacetylase [Chthoniobacterales bacterium]|nr:Sir2 family NAD-dependent protein deacetylase [Chthoniobacterales bacterium]
MLDQRILVITGAGISAESGIPTFRGKDGYWRNLDPAKLATPEAFQRDPTLVWEWYRERRARIRSAQPNDAHLAVARLAKSCRDFLLVTQNVDDLHDRAQSAHGLVERDRVVKIHGDIFLTRCSRCDHNFYEPDRDGLDVPLCPICGAMMRPGVVWFGETLDVNRIGQVESWLEKGRCDRVFVIGTTAMFGYIAHWALRGAEEDAELIEINPDTTALSQYATRSTHQPAGAVMPKLIDELLRG